MDLTRLAQHVKAGLLTARPHPARPEIVIYSYTAKCVQEGAWNEETTQARGMVVDWSDWKNPRIAANPFPRFISLPTEIPVIKSKPVVTEKIDGWLGIIWWNKDRWEITTRGAFTTHATQWAITWLHQYVEQDDLNKNKTYLVEMVHPKTKINIEYPYQGFVFLGVRDTQTGAERREEIPPAIRNRPPWYPSSKLMLQPARTDTSDLESLRNPNDPTKEGYVAYWQELALRYRIKALNYDSIWLSIL